jgi:transposase
MNKFKEYCKKKNEINKKIIDFYSKKIFRKLKLNGYMNSKKSEQRMIKNFEKIFGNKKDVIICIGDFEQKQHMKYKEPTKGKSIRDLFRNNGYELYLIDEFRTSCKCSNCGNDNCKFMFRKSPKPYKNHTILVHGLIRCKSCSKTWNRDCNGATNIYKIAKNILNNQERPDYLCRKIKANNKSDT